MPTLVRLIKQLTYYVKVHQNQFSSYMQFTYSKNEYNYISLKVKGQDKKYYQNLIISMGLS